MLDHLSVRLESLEKASGKASSANASATASRGTVRLRSSSRSFEDLSPGATSHHLSLKKLSINNNVYKVYSMLSLFKFYIINSLYVALITAHGAQRLLFVLLCRADHRRTSLGAAFRRPLGPGQSTRAFCARRVSVVSPVFILILPMAASSTLRLPQVSHSFHPFSLRCPFIWDVFKTLSHFLLAFQHRFGPRRRGLQLLRVSRARRLPALRHLLGAKFQSLNLLR